jgi:6-phosphogluconolactonase
MPLTAPHVLREGGVLGSGRSGARNGWRVFSSRDELDTTLSDHIAKVAAAAIAARGRFSIVLTGGRSVTPLYRRLRHIDTRWGGWHVYWGDERCLPIDDADRNSKNAMEAWLSLVPIPGSQIFPIPAELGPQLGAANYGKLLADKGIFDLVLLSLGDDGHVASLFGSHAAEARSVAVLPILDAPKSPSFRVSLSFERLAESRQLLVLVVGETKQAALNRLAAQVEQPATVLSNIRALDIWIDGSALQLPTDLKPF